MTMSTVLHFPPRPKIDYPESDGQPMADNTLQFQSIVTIQGGVAAVFRDAPNVFIAGDLFWYPVEGEPTIVVAPDTLVVFGRPKGHRRSYKQWEEDDIAPQVVWEVLSPRNTFREMTGKFQFYERHGVEEYYLYNPDTGEVSGWKREGDKLKEIPQMRGWVSPRLGVRFEIENDELALYGPDGRKFATYLELVAQREFEERDKEQAQRDKEQAQREAAEKVAQAERLAAQLRALGVEPNL